LVRPVSPAGPEKSGKSKTKHAALDPSAAAFADPSSSIGYLLRLAFRGFSRALERRTMQYGVSSGQWRFLRQLWSEDGITQRELSRRVGMREPTTVVAVNSLERAGLVMRVPSKEDRRKTHIHLTAKARALEAVLLPMVAEVQSRATRGLSEEEVAALHRALSVMRANLAEELAANDFSGDDTA
jgi:MarR family transcriptional regulator for hemolysin